MKRFVPKLRSIAEDEESSSDSSLIQSPDSFEYIPDDNYTEPESFEYITDEGSFDTSLTQSPQSFEYMTDEDNYSSSQLIPSYIFKYVRPIKTDEPSVRPKEICIHIPLPVLSQHIETGIDNPQNEGMGEIEQNIPMNNIFFGPQNLLEMYPNWDSIGVEYKQIPLSDQPITDSQMQYLNTSEEQLKNIRFIESLGEGQFGKVWSVTAQRWNQMENNWEQLEMACKVIRLRTPSNLNEISLAYEVNSILLNEMYVLLKLFHTNIVNLIDIIGIPDTRTGFPYSVTLMARMFIDLCNGDMISLMAQNEPQYYLTDKMCKYWFQQIASAVAYLHRNRVAHLDIKPENILYISEGKYNTFEELLLNSIFKLSDFGFALSFNTDEPTVTTHKRGTRSTMAPEMYASGPEFVDCLPCDVYSLGISLAKTLVSHDPQIYYSNKGFVTLSFNRMMNSFYTNKWMGRYRISENMVNLIIQMTQQVPTNRPTIEEVLTHDWLSDEDDLYLNFIFEE